MRNSAPVIANLSGDGGTFDAGGAPVRLDALDYAGDQAVEGAGAGTDTMQSSANFTLGANVENLFLTGAGAIDATGNSGANTLIGNGAANRLDGGAGADEMAGSPRERVRALDSPGKTLRHLSFSPI